MSDDRKNHGKNLTSIITESSDDNPRDILGSVVRRSRNLKTGRNKSVSVTQRSYLDTQSQILNDIDTTTVHNIEL